jgi:hypothetical protein
LSTSKPDRSPPSEVSKIREEIRKFFDQPVEGKRKLGSSQCAVYAFFDYDGEPIYVGQTVAALRDRVGRHLTGRRSDAVGKFVLDPFEVLEIEVWPFFDVASEDRKAIADRMEFTVFSKCLDESEFGAVLNEQPIAPREPIVLPPSYRARIIPDELFQERRHRDIRIARRAATFASLARLVSERRVDKGLRATLMVQAKRLERLSSERFADFADLPDVYETFEE